MVLMRMQGTTMAAKITPGWPTDETYGAAEMTETQAPARCGGRGADQLPVGSAVSVIVMSLKSSSSPSSYVRVHSG
jgi:hypothetical protein